MAEIALVHGGLAGAWCWEPFVPELARLGHRSVAMDLPIEDPAATLDDYAGAVVRAVEGIPRPWLIGHSMGGLVIPRVALARPVAGLIFLCAGFPPTSEAQHREDHAARDPRNASHFVDDGQGRITLTYEGAVDDFFADCPPEVQRWAIARFRPQATAPFSEYAPIPRYPGVPMHAIVTSEDHILLREPYLALIRSRIGVEPVELPGGHCPFVSRPRVLAEVVHRMVSA